MPQEYFEPEEQPEAQPMNTREVWDMALRDVRHEIPPPPTYYFDSPDQAEQYAKAYAKGLRRTFPKRKKEMFGDPEESMYPSHDWDEGIGPGLKDRDVNAYTPGAPKPGNPWLGVNGR